jgi:hypothetical protein
VFTPGGERRGEHSPWGQISPLGARGEIKNGPQLRLLRSNLVAQHRMTRSDAKITVCVNRPFSHKPDSLAIGGS